MSNQNLKDTRQNIIDRGNAFQNYIEVFVLHESAKRLLDALSRHCDVYIFSGVIRDYFLERSGDSRHLDIVVNTDLSLSHFIKLISRYAKVRVNSFGGLKIKFDDFNYDIWYLKDTWAIRRFNLEPTPEVLLETAFFNSSAIIYDYKANSFIISDKFCEFIMTNELDIVLKENPNIGLCILNIYHYKKILNCSISERLKNWIGEQSVSIGNLRKEQIRHFGKILYDSLQLD